MPALASCHNLNLLFPSAGRFRYVKEQLAARPFVFWCKDMATFEAV
jgi:hypothetical protein